MKPRLGNFVLVLHTHLPFVINHGKWPFGMEWLFEAASETYIPLLNVLNELLDEGRKPKLTISITPVLAEQLAHPEFVRQFIEFLDDEIRRCDEDAEYFRSRPREQMFLPLTDFWKNYYQQIKKDFSERYLNDLIGAFRNLEDRGALDIITCGATHGYFPLLGTDVNVDAQIKMAKGIHWKHFGVNPRGIWIPECAYRPRYAWTPPVASNLGHQAFVRKGVEEILDENGLEYFIVDSSLVEGGKAVGMYIGRFEALRQLMLRFEKESQFKSTEKHSVYEIYGVRSSADATAHPAVFARDVETSMQVWSSEQGYPGGEWYLDFHKKHHLSGHRYWRVTSLNADLGLKAAYQPDRIETALNEDADHFIASIHAALDKYKNETGRTGTLTAPFDSELFGHWWFEGPRFLKKIFERLCDDPFIHVTHCAEMIDAHPPEQIIALPEGSWGAGGNHFVWFNPDVEWMWKFIYNDELKLKECVGRFGDSSNPELISILKQMARELFLLESSDWPFLISTQSANEYAIERFNEHHYHFDKLTSLAEKLFAASELSTDDKQYVETVQHKDFLFDDDSIDLKWFA